jgi:hypothetical protein
MSSKQLGFTDYELTTATANQLLATDPSAINKPYEIEYLTLFHTQTAA